MTNIQLTRGMATTVDDDCLELLLKNKWQAKARRDGKGWYAVARGGRRMHRVILGASPGQIVDHINGDGLDNRKCNLRLGTQSQNCVNRKDTPGNYLRGTRPKKDKWQAYIKYEGKQRSLGYYDTEYEAHQVFLREATKLHKNWMPLHAYHTRKHE